MARSATANLTATARINDQASSGLKAIGKEARQMGQGFQKSAQVIQLFGGVAGEMGGKVSGAASQISGLAGAIAAGGPFGIALAAITIALAAYTKGLEMVIGGTKDAIDPVDAFNEGVTDQDKRLKPLIDRHKELTKALAEAEKAEKSFLEQFREGFDAMVSSQKLIEKMHDAEDKRRAENRKKFKDDLFKRMDDTMRGVDDAHKSEDEANKDKHAKFIEDGKKRLAESDKQYDIDVANYDAAQDEKAEKTRQVNALMGEMSGAVTSIIMADNEKQRDAAVRAAVSSALDRIQVAAAQAAAEAAGDAASSYPWPYNLIIAAAAGASVFGAILAFRAKVLGMASGGEVGGGIAGRDSVPALLMPGEIVMPTAVAREFKRMAEGRGKQSDSHRGSGGGDVHVTIQLNALDPESVSDVQLTRIARRLGNKIETVRSRGMIHAGRR